MQLYAVCVRSAFICAAAKAETEENKSNNLWTLRAVSAFAFSVALFSICTVISSACFCVEFAYPLSPF